MEFPQNVGIGMIIILISTLNVVFFVLFDLAVLPYFVGFISSVCQQIFGINVPNELNS